MEQGVTKITQQLTNSITSLSSLYSQLKRLDSSKGRLYPNNKSSNAQHRLSIIPKAAASASSTPQPN
jgi:hypothetical protein